MIIEPGRQYRVEFPFIKDVYVDITEEGSTEEETWVPGCRSVPVYPDDCEAVADDIGEMVLTIISVHKPGKYPERIFYTRKWVDPDGKEFGKGNLIITTTPTFKRRALGYYHVYRINGMKRP